MQGKTLDAKGLADVFRRIEDDGADNVDLITAEHMKIINDKRSKEKNKK